MRRIIYVFFVVLATAMILLSLTSFSLFLLLFFWSMCAVWATQKHLPTTTYYIAHRTSYNHVTIEKANCHQLQAKIMEAKKKNEKWKTIFNDDSLTQHNNYHTKIYTIDFLFSTTDYNALA